MANPTRNIARTYDMNVEELANHLPVQAANHLFSGGAVSRDSNGDVGHLATGESFCGFATQEVDNSGGAAAAKKVRIKQRGCIKLDVTGVDDDNDVEAAVYALDGNTFTLSSSSSAVQIGKVRRHITGTTCMVLFEAEEVRSV